MHPASREPGGGTGYGKRRAVPVCSRVQESASAAPFRQRISRNAPISRLCPTSPGHGEDELTRGTFRTSCDIFPAGNRTVSAPQEQNRPPQRALCLNFPEMEELHRNQPTPYCVTQKSYLYYALGRSYVLLRLSVLVVLFPSATSVCLIKGNTSSHKPCLAYPPA